METVKDRGDEKLYSKLDSAYATEDEETEVDIFKLIFVLSLSYDKTSLLAFVFALIFLISN